MAVLMILPTAIGAATPYGTYTYSESGLVLVSPAAYVPDTIVDYKYIGLDTKFDDARDLFVGPDNRVYLVDATTDSIIVMDKYLKKVNVINKFLNEHGVNDKLAKPSGVFVNERNIYVCDTDNNRIVMFDLDGNYVKIVPKPESNLFDEGAIYRPVACVVDDYGRIFVVSSTTYQGVIVLNEEGDFYGFIGAQKVKVNALDMFWRRFKTKEQLEKEQDYVSTEFNNIMIDDKNFIYVTTSSIDAEDQQNAIMKKDKSSDYAPVKKLNASGTDVMKRNGFYPPSGEVRVDTGEDATVTGASKIIDVAIGPEGTWSIIDENRSKVYTYDENGNLLFAFGDSQGSQIGNIRNIEAITYLEEKILLLDKENDNIVIFRRTEYGDLLMTALQHDNERQYDKTLEDWQEILKRNNNFDAAYVQIGKALYRQGKYEEAMENFKAAYNTSDYSVVYKEIRKEWANKYFWLIPIVIVVACVLIAKFMGYAAKVNTRTALKVGRKSIKEELLYAFHIIFHPFDGFWDLKHEYRGSYRSGFVILLTTVMVYFYNSIGQGYIFNPRPSSVFNVLTAVTAVVVPLLLWVVANWCLTTLFEGEGTMGDIFTACCYCLTPLPLLILPSTILSNFLAENEAGIITLLSSMAYIWMGLLLFIAMMVTHDYSVVKNILTCVSTIVGMAFLMFLGILFSTLMAKVVSFITNIISEISFRM